MANTIIEDLSLKIQEEITPSVRESLPAADGIFAKIKSSSMGVTRDTGIGRDYYVKHNFLTSLAGAFEWKSSPFGATTQSSMNGASGQTPVLSILNSIPSFPGADQAGNMGIVQRKLQLVQGNGNFFLPIQLFQADALSASTFKYVALNIRQVAKLVAQYQALAFYAPTTGAMAVIPTSGVSGGDGATITVTLSNGSGTGRIRNFYPGMFCDIQNTGSSYTSRRPSGEYFVVYSVDYIKRIIVFKTSAGGSPVSTVSDADTIVPYNCSASGATYGPSGLDSWIVSSGSPYNLDLSVYPQFSSIVDAVSGPLTESILNKYVGGFLDAYGTKLDTFITTGGVVREMLDQVEDLGVFQRQGAALNLKQGWTDIGYTYNGQNFNWLLSTFCAPGTLYGLKTGEGNLTRYVPPRVPGTGTNSEFDGDIQFIAPFLGSTGIFKPYSNVSGTQVRTTEVAEAPFTTLGEIAPNDIQGMKLTSITESNM